MPNTPRGKQPTGDEPENLDRQVERDMVRWTRAVAWFTGLLFLANIASNFFIWKQWE